MNTFLVGGAVRDALLGSPVIDRDWVVVGATPQAMIEAGYRPVGQDFPVFLHPETHEEHALARTERKSGPGYRGFVVNSDPSVTLEEDLSRRDLTVNAIAMDAHGTLIDPHGGQRDLAARRLRHVSDAFVEDPVRVLRVARFMARLAPFGFTVAEETRVLMQRMVADGEVAHLVPERVWQELERALRTATPRAFFETLRACDALAVILPELDALFGVPQPPEHHPEIDTGEHTLLVLEQTIRLDGNAGDDGAGGGVESGFAALCHDLGKGTTPRELWPSHHGHEARGAAIAATFAERLRVPRATRDLAVLSARFHTHCHRVFELRAATLCDLLDALDVTRRPERFERFVHVCEADARGRLGFASCDYPQAAHLRRLADTHRAVDAGAIAKATAERARIPEAIRAARIAALREATAADSAADSAAAGAAGDDEDA